MSTHAIFRPPPARQRAGPRLRAGQRPSARACSRGSTQMRGERLEIPLVIGGKDVTHRQTCARRRCRTTSAHVLADVHQGGAEHVQQAIDAAATAWEDWSRWPWEERAAVFLRAAELLAGPWRDTLLAATMLGQSKTAHQAEIDAAAEAIDFLRFNVEFMTRIYAGAADLVAGRLEPARVPPARGLRLRGLAVQLHGDRRQPDELGRADGQHRRLEAGGDGDALGVLPDAALPGGRAARRRDQPRLRHRRDDRRRGARQPATSPASTSPARRPSSTGCGGRSAANIGPLPQLPAHRRRDRRQGLHRRPPVRRPRRRSRRRSSAARSSTRARSARPPRASTRRRTSGPSCASGCRRRSRRSRSATSPTSATSWAP